MNRLVTPPARPIETRNPFARYFHGGLSLGVSYWPLNVLVGVVVEFGVILGLQFFEADGSLDPLAQFLLISSVGIALILIFVWLRVGVWQAARRRAAERKSLGKRAIWARFAQGMLILPVLFDLFILFIVGVTLFQYYPLAFRNDPDTPAYALKLLPNGTTLAFSGGVKFGLARDVQALLDASPNINTIELDSPGGRLGAAEQLSQLITARGLNTYVSGECESICTRIFVAGKQRLISWGAKLGFHSAYTRNINLPQAVTDAIDTQLAARYVAAGIDADFMRRAVAISPDSIWFPNYVELMNAHVVTRIIDGD
jgi:hypothetical protein